MREIKFRFWTPDKKMIDDHEGWVADTGINAALEYSKGYGYIAMQFTGLKDKNGKEIYEGDIVTMISYNYQHMNNYRWEVRYYPEGMMYKFYFSDGKKETYEDIYGWHSFEVIGNIYENPELISKPTPQ